MCQTTKQSKRFRSGNRRNNLDKTGLYPQEILKPVHQTFSEQVLTQQGKENHFIYGEESDPVQLCLPRSQ